MRIRNRCDMYPEQVLRLTGNSSIENDVELLELMSLEMDRLHTYIEDDHFLQEIALLYKSFLYQSKLLDSQFEIRGFDRVRRKKKAVFIDDDEVALNALVTNVFSVSKTLVEMIGKYCKSELYIEKIENPNPTDESKGKSSFELYISKIYDSMFSYRLGEGLRNVSLHGYQIITLVEEDASFDIEKILRVRHYKLRSLATDLERIRQEIYSTYYDSNALYSFNVVRLEYAWAIHHIYHEFMKSRLPDARERYQQLSMIEQKAKDESKSYFGYRLPKKHLPKYVGHDDINYISAINKDSNYVTWIEEEVNAAEKNRGKIKDLCKTFIHDGWSYDNIGEYGC